MQLDILRGSLGVNYALKVATGLSPGLNGAKVGRFGTIYCPKWALGLSPGLSPGFQPWETEALRAWLLSACPSGTKAILPSKRLRITLGLKGF